MIDRRRIGRRLRGCALLAAAVGAGAAPAAEPSPPSPVHEFVVRPAATDADRAWLRRGISRVEFQLDSLTALSAIETPAGTSLTDHALFDVYSRDVRHWAMRATQRMVRDHLLEAIDVDRILASRGGTARGAGRSRRLDFDFGIHRLMPEAELQLRLSEGDLKLSVDPTGDVGLRFRATGVKRGDFGLGFDGEHTYDLSFRVGF